MDLSNPILIAEDDDNDAVILQHALTVAGCTYPFCVCKDGNEVISYVRGEAPYDNRERYSFPRLLITDLKMPRMDGLELLEWFHQNPDSKITPTIVLTASGQPSDVRKAYRLGANSYLVRPPSLVRLAHMLKSVLAYWDMCERPALSSQC